MKGKVKVGLGSLELVFLDLVKKCIYDQTMGEIKVYRNGPVRVGEHSKEIEKLWSTYDAVKPSGRSGRLTSVYASPSLAGMVRWTHTNLMNGGINADKELTNSEIVVLNPEELYVYDVRSYDRTSMDLRCYGEPNQTEYNVFNDSLLQPYWDSGIRLTEWDVTSFKENLNPMDWEVLVPMDAIVSYEPIADKDIIDAAPEESREHLRQVIRINRDFIAWTQQEKEKAQTVIAPKASGLSLRIKIKA
jgi:hypothetical protein